MSVLIVSYDLRAPGRNYDPLYKKLRTYTHCHALESTWFLDTTKSASDVRTELCKEVDANDQIFVIKAKHSWAACKGDNATTWLKDPNRSWD